MHFDSLCFSSGHPASWLAGSTTAQLWAVPRIADKGPQEAGQLPKHIKWQQVPHPPLGWPDGWHSLWPHVSPVTRSHSWMFCMDTWSPMPDTPSSLLFSFFLLFFPLKPTPSFLSPKLLCLPFPQRHSSYRELPANSFHFPSTYTYLCTLWVNFSRPALLEWGGSWISRIHFHLV